MIDFKYNLVLVGLPILAKNNSAKFSATLNCDFVVQLSIVLYTLLYASVFW